MSVDGCHTNSPVGYKEVKVGSIGKLLLSAPKRDIGDENPPIGMSSPERISDIT